MFCRKCGKKLDLQDKFCNSCGEPVSWESGAESTIVPEPPKDLIWNVEGFPKDKKVEDVIFDWKTDSQGEDFVVDDFYINDNKNVSAQRLLDLELEKINRQNTAREEAILAAQAASSPSHTVNNQGRIFSEEIEGDLESASGVQPETSAIPQPEASTTVQPETAPSAPLKQTPADREPKTEPVVLATSAQLEPPADAPLVDTQPPADAPPPLEAQPPASTPPPVDTQSPAPHPTDIETLNIANKKELKYEDIFVEEEEEPKRKGSFFGKFLLILLILIIVLGGGFLGVKYYTPDNPYFKIVDEKVMQTVLTVESWFQVKEPVPEMEPEETSNLDKPAVEKPQAEEPVNPFPENKNIKEVSMNPSLVYVSGKEYGNVDINKSLPVIENTDQVISAIVEYDSKWIDYVNDQDKSVLDLTSPGSPAEKNTLNFTKAGKIKETFNSLEIGEVRKGTKGYYIWVREEIEILENNINTTKIYNWVYQITPVENQMKIVDYSAY